MQRLGFRVRVQGLGFRVSTLRIFGIAMGLWGSQVRALHGNVSENCGPCSRGLLH